MYTSYSTTEILISGLIFGLLCGVLTYSVLSAASLPDVWFSYSTGDCVKVLNYNEGDAYSCENLPSRYYHVWVN